MTTVSVREKLDVAGVIGELLDAGSFSAIRSGVRSPFTDRDAPGDGVVVGSGRIDGRRVFVFVQDPGVLGGSLGETHAASICRILDAADRFGSPVIGVHRSGGARIQEGVRALAGYARIFSRHVRMRRRVPQLAVVSGPCAGGASYGPALMDFVAMPASGAYMFLTGPDVVREVTGEEVDLEGLGGARVASSSGLAALVGDDDADTLARTRRLLSYLPSQVGGAVPVLEGAEPGTDPGAVVPSDPRRTYDVRAVVRSFVDVDSFLELKPAFAANLVVGLARLEGNVVGVVANQPFHLAGAIDIAASRKGAWFVETCDRFRIPLVVLVDTPGFLPGTDQERGGVIPAGAAFLSAFADATVPKLTVVLRKGYGGAFIVMNARDLGADYAFAWPTAEIAVLGARGAVRILHRRALAESDDAESLRERLEDEYRSRHCTPWPSAEGGFVDEVIEPSATRSVLVAALSG